MRTGSKIYWGITLFISFSLFSCSSETLESDMDRWCACEKQAATDALKKEECDDLKATIASKYEFDPGAVSKIKKMAQECNNSND